MTTNRAVIASIALLAGAVALAPSTASATARVVREIDGSHHDWALARCPVRDRILKRDTERRRPGVKKSTLLTDM